MTNHHVISAQFLCHPPAARTGAVRAGAVDELIASGALDDVTGTSDPIQAELDRVAATSGVDDELAALKGELSAGGTPEAIEASNRSSQQASGSSQEANPS